MHKISKGWQHLSIQYKAVALCIAFMLPTFLFISVLYSTYCGFQQEIDNILSEYSACMDFSAALSEETDQVVQLVYIDAVDKVPQKYWAAQEACDRCLEHLIETMPEDSAEIQSGKQIVRRSMQTYRESQALFLNLIDQKQFSADLYGDLQAQGQYLNEYMNSLTKTTLIQGQSSYCQLGQRLARRNLTFIMLIVICVLGMAIGVTALVRSIITPVRELSEASRQVSKGNFDIPDPRYHRTDEIGQLAKSFHCMKHQIVKTIHVLENEARMEKQLREHEAQEAHLSRLVEHSRFAQLQSQINPHFLFNTLQSIANMAELEQAVVSEDMILRLSKFFRYTLESDETVVTLAREVELLQDYISLQETRLGERVSFEIQTDPTCDRVSVPKFVLQPLVENAIIHGMKQRTEGGRVRVTIVRKGDMAVIHITDNGCGFHEQARPAQQSQHRSLGVNNIRERLTMFRGQLKIYSVIGLGTTVRIRIPLRGGAVQ